MGRKDVVMVVFYWHDNDFFAVKFILICLFGCAERIWRELAH